MPDTTLKVSMPGKRTRTIGSIANELLKKSREAALASVQIFNNPAITFKSEIFIVQMVISWTYLFHAYYRKKGIEYRYSKQVGTRRQFSRTAKGAYKYWELEACLNCDQSPLENGAAKNLRFLIGLRHEIEHQMTRRLDEHLSARYQACCLNYNDLIKQLFGDEHGIDKHLSFSLQFSSIKAGQLETLLDVAGLPSHIGAFINTFDEHLTLEEFNDPRFAYRLLFVPKTVNHKGQADKVIEFIKSDSELAKDVNKSYALIKDTEKIKYLPSQVVERMHSLGFGKFTMHHHTQLWKTLQAKEAGRNFGVLVVKTWHWYETWIAEVTRHCTDKSNIYAT
nr:DUF3644 domain-containing protein [uncultured Albidiferax sp.]